MNKYQLYVAKEHREPFVKWAIMKKGWYINEFTDGIFVKTPKSAEVKKQVEEDLKLYDLLLTFYE